MSRPVRTRSTVLLLTALLAGCGAGSAQTTPDASSRSARTPTSRAPDPSVVPAGWKLVSSLGVEFAVPSDWPVQGALGCGAVPPFVVLRGGGPAAACGHVDAPTATVVSVERTTGTLGTTTLPDGRTQVRAAVKGSPAMLTATGPDAALLAKVVDTLSQVDVDVAGCATRQPSRPAWDRSAAVPALRIADVSGVTVCVYDVGAGRLAASAVLASSERRELVEAVNSAKGGPVPDNPKDCAKGLSEDHAVLLLISAAGATTPLVVHYENCTNRYVAGEQGVSQVTARQLKAIYDPLHMGYGFSGDLPRL